MCVCICIIPSNMGLHGPLVLLTLHPLLRFQRYPKLHAPKWQETYLHIIQKTSNFENRNVIIQCKKKNSIPNNFMASKDKISRNYKIISKVAFIIS